MNTVREITNSELRARLQPTLLVQLTGPVEVRPGHWRFAAGTLVIAQFWGAGQIILNPVDPQDFPAAYVYTHALQDKVALPELGRLKGDDRPALTVVPDAPEGGAGER